MLQVAEKPGPAAATATALPKIGNYAVIGDCRTAALVSRSGSIDWLCLPHFSGPSMFAAILDRRGGGRFAVQPVGEFLSSRRYLPGTAVLETVFRTSRGAVRMLDLMPVAGTPGTLQPMREILRIIEGIEGEMEIAVHFEPRPDYGRGKALLRRRGTIGWTCASGAELLLLQTPCELQLSKYGDFLSGELDVKAGERHCFSLGYDKGDIGVVAPLGEHAFLRLEATVEWWKGWSGRCTYHGHYREPVVRSAITLKLMSYCLSGALIAAVTTSLPETLGAGRNWDYRYCWLRDAGLTMRAMTGLGYLDEGEAFLQWLLHATRLTWPELQVMYDVYGRTNLKEEELGHLSGFRDSRPVRIGNEAYKQSQLDVYGGVISAAYYYIASGGKLQHDDGKLLNGLSRAVCDKWREPDHGIWEIRGQRKHYTFSKVMCWTALDCIVRLQEDGLIPGGSQLFCHERDAIAVEIEEHGYNSEIGAYVSVFDGDKLDASLLLMGCLGYRNPADSRMRSTYAAIQQRLGRNGLIYRYEKGFDGMEPEEGAFGVCGFLAVDNLAHRGDTREAKRTFEHLLSFANDLCLMAEEVDVETGAALGNFPQAFTHAGLINAALAIEETDGGSQ